MILILEGDKDYLPDMIIAPSSEHGHSTHKLSDIQMILL
jgi:hypothetical protein